MNPYAYSSMLSAPTRTAPARSNRATRGASCNAGGRSRSILEPASVLSPAISKRFLTANGTPSRGRPCVSLLPAATCASSSPARRRALSKVRSVNALIAGFVAAMRAKVASTIAEAEVVPARTADAMVVASEIDSSALFMAARVAPPQSRRVRSDNMEDRRLIVFTRQRERVYQFSETRGEREVFLNTRAVIGMQRQRHQCGCGFCVSLDFVAVHVRKRMVPKKMCRMFSYSALQRTHAEEASLRWMQRSHANMTDVPWKLTSAPFRRFVRFFLAAARSSFETFGLCSSR